VRERVCTIVGVAPASFAGHQAGLVLDLWVPMRPLLDPKLLASRSMAFYSGVMGRLKPGISRAQAEVELTAIYQRMQAEEKPSPIPGEPPIKRRDNGITVTPGAQGLDRLRRDLGQPLLIALAVVVVVLLIASVNVASLMLARGAARTTEFATRLALGAGRARLMRQLMVEGLVLAGFGAALGILLAYTGAPALARLVIPADMAIRLETPLDPRVLGMATGSTMLVVLLAGLLPAFRLSAGGSTGLHAGMAIAGRSTGSRSSQRTTRALVAVQLALSLVLVTAAGLLLRTMLHVLRVDPGFQAAQVVLMHIQDTSPSAKFGETDGPDEKARRAALYANLDRKLNSVAGVQSASLSWLGLFGGSYVGLNVHAVENPEGKRFTLVDYVTPRYFETTGMQLTHGRGFGDGDTEGALRVAVVNEAFVRERLAAGSEPVGRRMVMTYANDLRPWTVVGVVRDSKYNNLKEKKSEPMMWVPLAQAPFKVTSASLRVRPGTQTAVIEEARAAMMSVSPHLMVRRVTTLQAQVDQSTARERMLLSLAAGFGGIAILLAAVGLYGILAYAVARRTREIGVRLALGAQRAAVLRSVLREALLLACAGMLLGIPLALASVRVIKSFLFGVTEYDVVAWVGAVVVLAGIALLAAFGPARRAAGVDPVIALRYE
jgi:macrolide transport system ATP-binding/permease protein